MKILDEVAIKNLMDKTRYVKTESENIQDAQLFNLLSIVNFLDSKRNDLVNDNLSLKDVMYSQYCWFIKFKNEYFKKYGTDAGIEQQLFKLSEKMDMEISNGLDWAIIEKIENEP